MCFFGNDSQESMVIVCRSRHHLTSSFRLPLHVADVTASAVVSGGELVTQGTRNAPERVSAI